MLQMLLPVVKIGGAPIQIDGELEGVEHLDLVVALQRGLLQAAGTVGVGGTRQDGKFHSG